MSAWLVAASTVVVVAGGLPVVLGRVMRAGRSVSARPSGGPAARAVRLSRRRRARLVEAARNLMDYIGEREVSHCSVHPPCDEPGDPLRRENYCAWCDRIAALRTALGAKETK